MANQSPEKTFRLGLISASVFPNLIENRSGGGKKTVRSVVLQRSFQDGEGEWKHTNSFGVSELPQAVRVLQLAQTYMESMEAETT